MKRQRTRWTPCVRKKIDGLRSDKGKGRKNRREVYAESFDVCADASIG